MMITAVNAVAICLYLLAAGLQGMFMLNLRRQAPSRQQLLGLGLIAVVAHAYSAIDAIYYNQLLDLGFFRAASLIFCFITAISLISLIRRPTGNLLVVLFPLASVSIVASQLAPSNYHVATGINPGIFSHLLTSILAYSLMTIASIQAVTLALQERHIKHRHLGGVLQALPPLQTMEQILFELIWIGMVLLSLSIITGLLFIDDIFAQHLAHKVFFSVVAWCIFAILLWGRHQLGWRGQTAVRWTLGGFFALMLGYFGSKFVLELLLA